MVEESEVEIDVNEVELSLYLVSNLSQEEVDTEGWIRLLPLKAQWWKSSPWNHNKGNSW